MTAWVFRVEMKIAVRVSIEMKIAVRVSIEMKIAVRVSIESAAIALFCCVTTTKVKPGLYVMCNSIVLMYLLPISCAGGSHDIFISLHGTVSYKFRLSSAIFMEKIIIQINSYFVRTCHQLV
jgi:hypothetical protein